ncbi:MAG: UDP-N-acetylglucosamine 2-epimerase (hydrolyzing) [Lachnospiraceae bacterium]|nr:UDP-N-acetylglucosamine 2-epimerase (hydrolyzing) [Lachnospiraceae bacterium]
MKKIVIVTATRAEYGLLSPLIKRVDEDNALELDLIVTGTHLSHKHGYTIDDIRNDGVKIAHEIPILEDDNTPYGISITMANAMKGFAKCFKDNRPDIVVILGDRTEMLGVAAAALNERIPIAHVHGGEVTEGAVDDCIRHAITKMSYIHFASTEAYRQRVIQMGEEPDRVFNVGALGVENILNQKLMEEDEIRADIGIPTGTNYVVVTFHPATMEDDTASYQVCELCKAMNDRLEFFYLITGANADVGGDCINEYLQDFVEAHSNALFVTNLGMRRYLSAIKHASFVMGNSSSGIIEAPAIGTPTINIGDRQKGRIHGPSIIDCNPKRDDILFAMKRAMDLDVSNRDDLYGKGDTSVRIVEIIKDILTKGIDMKKEFYDLSQSRN